MNPLVIVDNSVISAILRDRRFREAFPFIQQAASNLEALGKPCCGRRREATTIQNGIIVSVKRSIASMPDIKKQQFKTLLDATRVRLVYLKPQGGSQTITF